MMPKIVTFKGEAPRIARRKLPVEFAGDAVNARLLSGDLEAWRNFSTVEALCKDGDIVSIYPMREPVSGTVYWLHWTQDELGYGAVEVDVARTTIANDTSGRIFLTGLDLPRWTNLALATTGSGCYPIETRILGVIAPLNAPTVGVEIGPNPPIDIFDDFTNPSNWVLIPEFVGPFTIRRAEIFTTPDPLLRLTAREISVVPNGAVYAYRDFAVGSSAAVEYSFDFRADQAHTPFNEYWAAIYFMCDQFGGGPRLTFGTAGIGVYAAGYSLGTSWAAPGSPISSVPVAAIPVVGSNWYRVVINATRRTNANYDIRIVVRLGSGAPLFNQVFSNVPVSGGYCGHGILQSLNADRGPLIQSIANVIALASAPINDQSDDTATSYVYTFVNDIGEESAPSPASETIIRDDGAEVIVTSDTTVPTGPDYYIVTKRIYRAATGAAGTAFFFVAEIPLAQAEFTDTLTDQQLGETLQSTNWDLPPPTLRGLLALPNGIYAGFFDNQLCLSAIGRPHAWPVTNRLPTDEPIVAIGAVDNQIIIATVGYPYLGAGNDPSAFSMTKLELPQGCVSKRGCAYLRGFGWIYPSPDGLIAIAGTGQSRIITETLYTRKEWQKLSPESLIAIAHDNRYHGFYTDCFGNRRGLMLDVRESGFGAVTLGFHATAVAVQPVEDRLYMVLDANDVPHIGSPSRTDQVVPDGRTVYAFDQYCDCTGPQISRYLPYRWRSKKFMTRGDLPLFAVVRATDYADVVILLYNQGYLYFAAQVTSNKPFRLPKAYAIDDYFEVELIGTSAVQVLLLGYGIEDFGDGA